MTPLESRCGVFRCEREAVLPLTYGGEEWPMSIPVELCSSHLQLIAAGAEYWWDERQHALHVHALSE